MMIDALNATGPAILELIHLDEPRERAYWAHVLSLSEDELTQIVNRVGPRAIDVRRHLTRARHEEWQHRAHQSRYQIANDAQVSNGDPLFALIVCGLSVVATTFGALAYGLMPPDEWTVLQREYGCEAVANSDPTIEQVRCPDGRTVVRTKLFAAAEKSGAARVQEDLANNRGPSDRLR
jgi:hypothetical protein